MGCQPSQNPNRQIIPVEQVDNNILNLQMETWQLIPAKTTPIFQEYHFMNYISRSNNSYLRKIKHRKSKFFRVAKVYYRTKQNQLIALNQINAMKKLDHPNIIRLHQYYLDQSNIYLVFEYIDGEQLFGHLLGVDESVRQNFPLIFHQLLSALQYCHKKGFAHMGIEPQNIIIVKKNQSYLLKLVGFSKVVNFLEKRKIPDDKIQIKRMESRISAIYRAPQVSTSDNIEKADIWMAGLILLIVISGRNFMIEIDKQDISEVINQWEEQNPDYYKLVNLVRHMLDPNPVTRYSAKQCLNHSFLSDQKQEMYRWRMTLVYNFLHNFKEKNRLRKLFQMHILHRISTVHDQTQFMVQFTNLDKNKDGVLDESQLIEGLMNSYFINKQEAEKYVKQILEKLDRNKNNRLEYSEFMLGTIQVGKIINENNIEKIFNEIDANNDGYITLEELQNMFYDLPVIHQLFDKQKGITLKEFKNFMQDLPSEKQNLKQIQCLPKKKI